MANGRCHKHGGATPVGAALPQFKHGRYSKVLPVRLAARYQAALADPDLLALHHEIALLDARLGELVTAAAGGTPSGSAAGAAGAGASGSARASVEPSLDVDVDADADADADRAAVADADRDAALWAEVAALVEQRRKLVESERRRLLDLGQYIPVERALALVAALTEVVNRHVTDPATLGAIHRELGALLDRRAAPALGPGRAERERD